RSEQNSDPQQRRLLSARIARLAGRTEPLLSYFRRVFFHVDKEKVTLSHAVTLASDDFPRDLGPAQRELLDAFIQAGMVTMEGDAVAAVGSADLRYLGGGRWLEEYCYLTLRDLHLFDEVVANLVVSGGEKVENELDVVAARRGRLFFFSCKTGGAVGSWRKDDLAQEEVFKLETLRDLAGGTFARAVLVAGSGMTPQLKQRCGRLGIDYVDVDNLHRLDEFARRVAGA
ncbi:MAG: Card1-like endonuclease domain-containing protein, partial [Candidatus Binatia bacterium]